MCTTNTKYANTGLVNISTANPNLDGTGSLGMVLSPIPSSSFTLIDSITIKATESTKEGMVRLFINTTLFKEIYIPEVTQTQVVNAFQISIDTPNLILSPTDKLYASTEEADSFNIFANGVDFVNCACTNICNCSDCEVTANTGLVNISIANSKLDGTGSISTLLMAPLPGSLVYGSSILNVDIKATQSTKQGMIRLFIDNTISKFLIWEIPIPACTQTNVQPAYRTTCFTLIDLKPGYKLCVSTENAESFNIITFANDVINCPCLK